MSKITFQQATQGYLLAAGARHLNEHTIRDYVNAFTKLTAFLKEDKPLEDITRKDFRCLSIDGRRNLRVNG